LCVADSFGEHLAKAFLDMLGVFAEFETNLRKERQLEGIAKAKAAGVYKGRKPSVDVSQMRALKQKGIGPSSIERPFLLTLRRLGRDRWRDRLWLVIDARGNRNVAAV
jgi:DNA invertase Pin-like site-specific DNA recombinase